MRSIALDDLLQREHAGASFHDASIEGYYFDARSRALDFYVQVAFYGVAGGEAPASPGCSHLLRRYLFPGRSSAKRRFHSALGRVLAHGRGTRGIPDSRA